MTYEVESKDWSEVYEWLITNLPQSTCSHTWCDYEHPETGAWTGVILFHIANADEDEHLLFKLSMSHVLRGTTQEESHPETN